jgi:carboxylesterase
MDETVPVGETAAVVRGAQTIDLQEEGSPGVLLLHGFGDTPQTLALLARHLHKCGYSLYVPLLPGHGRDMKAFKKSGAADWIRAARSAFADMRSRHDKVSLVGLSMGGALATIIASEQSEVPALVLIAPYLAMPRLLAFAAATHRFWEKFAGELNSRDPRSIRDPIEREKNLAYGKVTGSALFELLKVVRRARGALRNVRTPTLIIQSRDDPRCTPATAEFTLAAIGSEEKKLIWTEEGGHIVTVDYGRERVFNETEKWLTAHNSRSAAAT